MAAKRKSPIKQMIDEALSKVEGSGFPDDPELEDEGQRLSGPERFVKGQKQKDEIIIDSLLADISGKEGYFLKLKKEMRPNEWMLMKTIETEWRNWPDIETAVANIVKDHTKTAPQKWGSGPYRIEYACKGGMRGKGYPSVDFYINAEEEFLNINGANGGMVSSMPVSDPTTQVTAQLDMLGKLMDVIKGVQPAPLDPAVIQKQNADAFQQGLAIKANEGNQSAQMMTAMMTGLMGMITAMATNKSAPMVVNPNDGMKDMLETLKTFGVLETNKPQPEKQKTIIEFMTELKALGMDPLKKDDPIAQITQLKALAGVLGDVLGGNGQGERPGIVEKLIDAFAPHLPKIISDIKGVSDNIAAMRQPAISVGTQQLANHEGGPIQVNSTQNVLTFTYPAFEALYHAIQAQDVTQFTPLYNLLIQAPNGSNLVLAIIGQQMNEEGLIQLVQNYGGEPFKLPELQLKMKQYFVAFIAWLRDIARQQESQAKTQTNAVVGTVIVVGKCAVCNTEYEYDSLQEWQQEVGHECEVGRESGEPCPGIIVLVN